MQKTGSFEHQRWCRFDCFLFLFRIIKHFTKAGWKIEVQFYEYFSQRPSFFFFFFLVWKKPISRWLQQLGELGELHVQVLALHQTEEEQQPRSSTCQLGDLITNLWCLAVLKNLFWALFSSVQLRTHWVKLNHPLQITEQTTHLGDSRYFCKT